jgi:hypothetical protein
MMTSDDKLSLEEAQKQYNEVTGRNIIYDLFDGAHLVSPEGLPEVFVTACEQLMSELNKKVTYLIPQLKAAPPERLAVLNIASPRYVAESFLHLSIDAENEDSLLDEFINFIELAYDWPVPLADEETEH